MSDIITLSRLGLDPNDLVWSVLDQSPDCIKILSLDGRIEYMNPNGLSAMEIADFPMIAGRKLADLWPEESRPLLDHALAGAAIGRKERFDAFCPTALNNPRWWAVSVSPLNGKDGKPAHILCSSRDISWWRAGDDYSARSAAESDSRRKHASRIAHDARNQIATIGALARISLGSEDVPAHRIERFMDRIGKLIVAADASSFMTGRCNLAEVVRGSLRDVTSSSRVRIAAVAEADISHETARTIAVVLGELASNALDHGAIRMAGQIDVSVLVDAAGNLAHFRWNEQFENASAARPRTGTGMRIMERLTAPLARPIRFDWTEQGMKAGFAFDLA